MGEFTIMDAYNNPVAFTGDARTAIVAKISQVLNDADISNKQSDNAFIKFLKGITSFTITLSGGTDIKVEYAYGRKDMVLTRMYEDKYITAEQLKSAFVQGLGYQFRTNAFPISAPHFVQRIIEEAEKKIDKETLAK